MTNKFDELLTQLGTGKWNLFHFILSGFYYFLIPGQILGGVYLAPYQNHTCIPPDLDQVVEVASDSCSYFVSNSSSEEKYEFPCTEFEYDTSVFESTLTSEFNLVCDKAYFRATYFSIYMFATIFSAVLAGYIADKFGRKSVAVFCQISYALLAFSIAFLPNFSAILAVRFLMGCVGLSTSYILCLEVCELKYRSIVGILIALPWAIGTMVFGGIAYLVREWRWLQIYVTLPYALTFPALLMISESPRWLIVRGEFDRAMKVLQRAARWNNKQLPPTEALHKLMIDIREEIEESERTISKESGNSKCTTPTIFRTRSIRIILIIFSINLFISSLVFGGLSLSGANYSADPFLYIVIGGLMEIPGYTVTAPLINRFGRRWPTILGYAISGVVILLLVCIPEDISWLVMTLAMLGKLSISGAFMIVYMYMSELMPTEVRLLAVGITTMTCQVGATIAPFVTEYLGPIVPWAPSVIFGVSSLIAALVMLPLPETLGKPMPDSIQDLPEISLCPTCSSEKDKGQPHEEEKLNMARV